MFLTESRQRMCLRANCRQHSPKCLTLKLTFVGSSRVMEMLALYLGSWNQTRKSLPLWLMSEKPWYNLTDIFIILFPFYNIYLLLFYTYECLPAYSSVFHSYLVDAGMSKEQWAEDSCKLSCESWAPTTSFARASTTPSAWVYLSWLWMYYFFFRNNC